MGEYRNNPAIFDRLNYTKSLDKSNGVASLQHVVAGDGDNLTTKQLYAFRRELRLRKAFKYLVFFSIPALTLYYKRNFALGVVALLASSFLADKAYSSSLFNSNDAFTKEYIKKSQLNYFIRVGKANEMLPFNAETLSSGKILRYTRKEFNELYKYR